VAAALATARLPPQSAMGNDSRCSLIGRKQLDYQRNP
jgi:hypothetical protein